MIYISNPMNSIYLCGLLGCGITAMSNKIAAITSKRCILPETFLQNKYRMTSQHLCDLCGIEDFLCIEEDCLEDICKMNNTVIPFNLYTLFDEDNIKRIKQNGVLIYLYQPFDVFAKKLVTKNKGSYLNKLSYEELLDSYTRWHTICKISANHTIDVARSHKPQLYKLFGKF